MFSLGGPGKAIASEKTVLNLGCEGVACAVFEQGLYDLVMSLLGCDMQRRVHVTRCRVR